MRLIPHICAAVTLVVSLGACEAGFSTRGETRASTSPGPGVAPPATAKEAPATTAPARRTDPLAGLTCEPSPTGWARRCATPAYDVTGTPEACPADSTSFGAVVGDRPLPAHDRLGDGARAVATLAPGQFVCIQYTADPAGTDGERWVYVTAIAPASVAACSTANCGDATARSRWNDGHAGACMVVGTSYSAGCPAGWVPAARLDEYSMGLGGTHAGE